jgi:transcriptional regulator with XRE-family HTH domain
VSSLIGDRIRIIRESKNMTQETLGNLSGFTQSQISKIESNTRRVTIQDLPKLATALGVSVSDLLEEQAG